MTTIAYNHKDKTISIDSRITGDYIVDDTAIKYTETESGIYFLCGETHDYKFLISQNDMSECERELNCSGLIVKGDVVYNVYWCNGLIRHYQVSCNEVAGSGCEFALAAMDFGKSSKEAVEYAATRCHYTGGKVHTYDVVNGKWL